ncbi:COME operon protein 3 [Chlamydia trachomatis]|nr:COME operon protein 3 [Chlamydia trachomatis]CRH66245.1 COME operon protein 3 [Chlamydia trachomatis]CRI74200.1 COME operon protein 3 [Chlamydia trachomatis]
MIRMFKILPLDGLIYNLFYPTLVMPIFLMIPLSFLNPLLSHLSESYISWILDLPWLHAPNVLISLTSAPPTLEWITLVSIILVYIGALSSVGKAVNTAVDHSIIL